jgi:magnesium transporter
LHLHALWNGTTSQIRPNENSTIWLQTTASTLHPLHIEDCRQAGQRAKLAKGEDYLFVSLKLLALEYRNRLSFSDLALFLGKDFVITVHKDSALLLEPLRHSNEAQASDEILYDVLDRVVESYLAVAELLDDGVEELEAQVVGLARSRCSGECG